MTTPKTAHYWIDTLRLQPHPEGGYFAETYRSTEAFPGAHLPPRYTGDRCFSTAIYFLVDSTQFSALHRIQSDEIWHFYTGSPLSVWSIEPGGALQEIRLGSNIENGEVFQAVVPAGCWFGSEVRPPGAYALVGCTVAPGFDFADFELADRAWLTAQYPQHREVIARLTR